METEEQELKKLEKSAFEEHAGLSLGLFSTALIPKPWEQIIPLLAIGTILALSAIYLICMWKFGKPNRLSKFLSKIQIKHVNWFLGFAALGIGLIQKGIGCLVSLGIASLVVGYAILILGNLAQLRLKRKS